MQTFADLLPALFGSLREHHVPQLPTWYPPVYPAPTRENPQPAPRSDAERAMLRRQAARQEAVTGPHDGRRVIVSYPDGGQPPELYEPSPGWWYRLDRETSTPHHLRYRYDPSCPAHQLAMTGIVQAYVEAGPEYTAAARMESPDEQRPDRPVPSQR